MVVHGEDSLNEHSEDVGPPINADALGKLFSDNEPTLEQLIATGEADEVELEEEGSPEETEEVPEEVEEPSEPGTAVATTKEDDSNLSIRKQVEKRLLAGASRDELLAEGYNKSTISTVASEVKKKTGTRTAVGKAAVTTAKGLPIFAKGSPPEAIIEAIEVPDVSNGQGYPFEQGIKFGMSLVTLGIRMAQELSGIGVMQAKPLLDMAKSMREGESLAAKNAAGEAAMEAAGLVQQSMMPLLAGLQKPTGNENNPMQAMMARTMEPIMGRLMGGALSKFTGGATASQQPAELTQNAAGAPIDGWVRKSE